MILKHQAGNLIPGENFSFINRILKGFGQIMLQENALTGLLFLAGIFLGSITMGVAALLAAVSGTATAIVLKYDRENTDKGLYGFSASLTGVALMLFFKPAPAVWLFVICGSVMAAMIQHFFIKRNMAVYTLPFVLVTWLIYLFLRYGFPGLLVPAASADPVYSHFLFPLRGFGQVIFQEKVFSGLLFFTAVFISSPLAALYGLAGALLSGILSQYLAVEPESISRGLLSFNAVLCAILFSGNQFRNAAGALVSVLLSLIISVTMLKYNLIQLTFPFVAASVITLFIGKVYQTVRSGSNR